MLPDKAITLKDRQHKELNQVNFVFTSNEEFLRDMLQTNKS